jgi:polyphosphate kinase
MQIIAKMNSSATAPLPRLYAASRAGVKIRLNVRGICILRPGLKFSNIEVAPLWTLRARARAYFHNGGDDDPYVASAD